jgi:ABC-type nickel/cobalt efflux system permease component RcnA
MEPSLTSVGSFALLALGLMFGLKHATEVDHVVAVSTLVSEHRNLWRAAIVGALWGAGHTTSVLLVGVLVLVYRVTIPPNVAKWLEFGVALMIIGLGVLAITRVFRRRPDVHLHRHSHDGQSHVHLHFHEHGTEHTSAASSTSSFHSHAISRIGLKPILVGALHGLAGSAALTLLLLTQIQQVWLSLAYLALFGIGSTVGMMLMSGLIGLPFVLSGRGLTKINYGLQTVSGSLSIVFGLWYAYQVSSS